MPRDRKPLADLPDFIIAGGMKCGTSSLHEVLARHPQVFMPPGERKFFDLDDVDQNRNAFARTADGWLAHDYEGRFEQYLNWYRSCFTGAAAGQLIGDDATTYMTSARAPRRMAELLPDVKLIFLLRDPVERTYSHYWQDVRTGRATETFENTILFQPGSLLIRRSLYKEQIERYREHFNAAQMQFVIFEEFVRDMPKVVADVCAFLGLEFCDELVAEKTHANPSRAPRWLWLRLLQNRWLRDYRERREFLNVAGAPLARRGDRVAVLSQRVLNRLNRPTARRPPPMRTETREFLRGLFARENAGLSELIGRDVGEFWK